MTHSIRIVAIVIAAIGFCCLAALSFAQSVPAGCAQWIKVDEKTICFEDYISKLNFFTDYSKSHPSIGCCRWWCGSDGKADCDVGGGGGGNAPTRAPKSVIPHPDGFAGVKAREALPASECAPRRWVGLQAGCDHQRGPRSARSVVSKSLAQPLR
jgi:hypothetical protein